MSTTEGRSQHCHGEGEKQGTQETYVFSPKILESFFFEKFQ